MVQRSNPTATRGCEEEDCLPCRGGRGDGGDCRQCGVNYSVECQLCPDGSRSIYYGETARNLYTRGLDHEKNYNSRKEKSFMLKHQEREHHGRPGSYKAKVTATAKDCLTRQVREAVHLRRSAVPTLNSKTEWHQPALFRIQREIFNGWCGCESELSWGVTIWKTNLLFILPLYIFIYVQWIVLNFLFVHSSLSVLKRPEGETLSALQNIRNVQVTFAFDDNLCNFRKVNHIFNNN